MRQYRGKRIDNGEWVYGWYQELDGDSYISSNVLREVLPASVGQSTGKTDGKDNDVFGGDILKSLSNNRTLEVFWSESQCAFMARGNGHANLLADWNIKNFGVIGNITDNPELLKEQ